jgi:hypothetical protein
MGFKSQNALINVDWSESALAINPNRMPLGKGNWVASPRIEFTPQGRYLVFDGGPILENVDFTQEMSNTWLRYVSPILGSATSIEGQFSLSASPARVAMSPPYTGALEGVIDIHSAQVGPGPLTQQILGAISSIQTMLGRLPNVDFQVMTVAEQQVPFAYADGRVYHKDLKVSFGEVFRLQACPRKTRWELLTDLNARHKAPCSSSWREFSKKSVRKRLCLKT